MDFVPVISGHDLKSYLTETKQPLAAIIDSKGTNLIDAAIIDPQTEIIRVYMMIKIIKQREPLETYVDFPLSLFNRIKRHAVVNGTNSYN